MGKHDHNNRNQQSNQSVQPQQAELKKDKIDDFIQKTLAMKKENRLDLSSDEDLSIAIMNLVSIEEHFFFTANKTGDTKYFDLLMQIREMRKGLLKRIIKKYEGEVWCISKHLLAASMRLMEYGTKLQSQGKTTDAQDIFRQSYELYSLFWGLNLNLIDAGEIKKINEAALNKHDSVADTFETKESDPEVEVAKPDEFKSAVVKPGFMGKLGDLVKKAIDCCIE